MEEGIGETSDDKALETKRSGVGTGSKGMMASDLHGVRSSGRPWRVCSGSRSMDSLATRPDGLVHVNYPQRRI